MYIPTATGMSLSDSSSPLLKLEHIQGRGRSLVASHPIKAGQILLHDAPILLYPSSCSSSSSSTSTTTSNYCSHCFRNLDHHHQPLICPTCPNFFFCGPTCQSSALASSHSPWVCSSLALVPSLPPHLQPQALFLVSAYNLASLSPPLFTLLLSLHGDPLSSSAAHHEALALHSFISSLSPSAAAGVVGFSPALTAALLAKDKHNAFGLMEPFSGADQRSVRAYGIYPNASFFNHDCLPNACRFDYLNADRSSNNNNTNIIVRAIHDIEQGREICLSYFPVNWSYADRQRRLLEDYGFVCDCDRCQVERNWRDDDDDDDGDGGEMIMDEDPDEQMESATAAEEDEEEDTDFPHAYFFVRYLCQRENCGGTLAPLPPTDDGMASNILECNVCGQLRKEEDQCEDDLEDGNMLDK